MRALVLSLLLVLAPSAFAKKCLPSSPWISVEQSGGKLMQGVVPPIKGEWFALWCPTGSFAGETEVWTLNYFAVLDKYRVVSSKSVFDALQVILQSAEPVVALEAMLKAGEFIPPAGTQDRFELETLLYAACQQGAAVGYGPSPAPVALAKPCTPPTPLPTTPTQVWKVTPSGSSLFLVEAGRLKSPIAGRRAPGGSVCDHLAPAIKSGTATYYPLSGAASNEYAACVKVN